MTLRFTLDERSGPVKLSYKVTDQYGYSAVSKAGLERTAGARSIQLTPRYPNHKGFVPGVYRVQLTVRDEAGNVTVTKRRSFRDSARGERRRVAPHQRRRPDGRADLRRRQQHAPGRASSGTLKRYKAHATFFPLGSYVASSPSLARRTVQDGNAIGTHGWTHSMMTRQSASQIQSEWTRAAAPWWSATGYSPVPYCRPPYGDMNSATTSASAAIGFYRVILWDVDPRDWSQPGAGVIVSRVLSHVHPGAIVCMHLTPQTAQALPSILSGLQRARLQGREPARDVPRRRPAVAPPAQARQTSVPGSGPPEACPATTARNASPYRSSLAWPTPFTSSSSARVAGRSAAISASVASLKTT